MEVIHTTNNEYPEYPSTECNVNSLQEELFLYATSCDDMCLGSTIDEPTETCTDLSCPDCDEGEELYKQLYGDERDSDDAAFDYDSCDDSQSTIITQFHQSEASIQATELNWVPVIYGGTVSTDCSTKRKVRFGDVHIREYSLTVGDHPGTTDMCPMTLAWEHGPSSCQNIIEFEYCRLISRPMRFRRLCLDERRIRIKTVSGIDEVALKTMETELAQVRLQEVTEQIEKNKVELMNENAMVFHRVEDAWLPVGREQLCSE